VHLAKFGATLPRDTRLVMLHGWFLGIGARFARVFLVVQVQDDLAIQLDILLWHYIWQRQMLWDSFPFLHLQFRELRWQWRRLQQHHWLNVAHTLDHTVVSYSLRWSFFRRRGLLSTGPRCNHFNSTGKRTTRVHGSQMSQHVVLSVDSDVTLDTAVAFGSLVLS